jgi:GDPmannose 4,6-dehydratase
MTVALITGISGQDGAYLARLLLSKNYEVWGGSRDSEVMNFSNLEKLGIRDQVNLISISLIDFRSVWQALYKIKPDEIYNLGGQSSVGLSFNQPVESLESIAIGSLNLLEAVRLSKLPIKIYNAGSSECFGDANGYASDEDTAFRPRSPYAVAKSTAFWETANYREAYDIFACSGILFNHDSPLRPERFVTQKIISTAVRISKGSNEKLILGNLNIRRDWGWAPEYVEAMWLMLQQSQPEDFIIATGESNSLKDFVFMVFSYFNLNWTKYTEINIDLMRPSDLLDSIGNPIKAKQKLGWEAKMKMNDVIREMIKSKLEVNYYV